VFSTPKKVKKEKHNENDDSIDISQQNSSDDFISSTPEKVKSKKSKESNNSDTNERIKNFKPTIDLTEITSIKKNKRNKDISLSITSETSNVSLKNGDRLSNGTANLEVKNETNGMKKHKRKSSVSINKNVSSNKENNDSKSILDKYLESINFVDDWNDTKLTNNSSEVIELESDNQSKNVILTLNKSKRTTKSDKKPRESINGSYSAKENDVLPESSLDKYLCDINKKECVSIDLIDSFNSTNTSLPPTTFVKKQKKKKYKNSSIGESVQPETSITKEKHRKHKDSSIEESVEHIDLTDGFNSTNTSVQPPFFVKEQKKKKHKNSLIEESVQPEAFVKKQKHRNHIEPSIEESVESTDSFNSTNCVKKQKKKKHKNSSIEDSVYPETSIKKEKSRKHNDINSSIEESVEHIDLTDGFNSTNTSIQPTTFVKKQKKRKHKDSLIDESVQPESSTKKEKHRKYIDSSFEESVPPQTSIKQEKKRKYINSSIEENVQLETSIKKENKQNHKDFSNEESDQPESYVKKQKEKKKQSVEKEKKHDDSCKESVQPQTFVKNEEKHRDSTSKDKKNSSMLDWLKPNLEKDSSFHDIHNESVSFKSENDLNDSSNDRLQDYTNDITLLTENSSVLSDPVKLNKSKTFKSDNDFNDSIHNRLQGDRTHDVNILTENSSVLSDPGKKQKENSNKLFDNSELKIENNARLRDSFSSFEEKSSLNASKSRRGSNIYTTTEDDSDSEYEKLKSNKFEIQRTLLKSLEIIVNFPVPKLHEICNRASKPTPQQRIRLAQENLTIKIGKFTKVEDDQIKENWETFLKLYNFEDSPEIFISLNKQYISNEQKQNFLFFLAQNLPERTPYGVYLRFKNLMIQRNKGRFTEEEDKYILEKMEESGRQRNYMVEIAQHLQRTFSSVEKRIQKLKETHTRKIRWRREENLATFIKYMLKVTRISQEEIEKLKNRSISSKEWKKVSKKLDNVPIRILKRAWMEQIHPKLFIEKECFDLREAKRKLVNMFYENNERDWRSVDWRKYASYFDGLTPIKIFAIMKNLVYNRVPTGKQNDLRKCIKLLKKSGLNDLAPHVIYKVRYKDGEIEDCGKK